MQVTEVLVFMTIAVIIGAMVVGFVVDWDAGETQEQIKGMIMPEEGFEFRRVDTEEFAIELYNFWRECGFGELNKTGALYVYRNADDDDIEDDELTKRYIFAKLKQLNWCSSLQSEEYGCGEGEDVEMEDDIELPALVRLDCSEHKLIIRT